MNILPGQGEYKVVIDDEPNTTEFPDCIRERWFLNGKLHRGGDEPAIIVRKKMTGEIVHQVWAKNNREHRDYDLPAIMKVHRGGKYYDLDWYTDGKYTKSFTVSKRTGQTVTKVFYADALEGESPDDYLCTAYNYDEDTGELTGKQYSVGLRDLDDANEMPHLPFPTPEP